MKNFSFIKNNLSFFYRKILLFNVLLKIYFNFIFRNFLNQGSTTRIFYAGAKKGNLGGPLTKTKKLNKYFPEDKFRFNIVYVLSNFPFFQQNQYRYLKGKKYQ